MNFTQNVIPGSPKGRSPESMNTGLWKMDSGPAAVRRPGMTLCVCYRCGNSASDAAT